MARVKLNIRQPINQLTLKTMLEARGHIISEDASDIFITDDYGIALRYASSMPTLVLATAQQIGEAVELMKKGVYGYIFIPFQPDEACLMIERALGLWGLNKRKLRNEERSLTEIETEVILQTLAECHFNRSKTARRLGIGRNTLWRKLKRIKMNRKTD